MKIAKARDRSLATISALTAVLVITMALTLGTSELFAESPTPLDTVKGAVDDTVAILHNVQEPVKQRRRELRQLVEQELDLGSMARTSLGIHWSQLNAKQRDEFVPLFAAFIETVYLDQIQDYAKLKIEVSSQTLVASDYARVSVTVLQPSKNPIPIVFLLEKKGVRWVVYDVNVEGISMVENYRAQFDRVIRSGGIDGLMNKLRQKRAQLVLLLGESSS